MPEANTVVDLGMFACDDHKALAGECLSLAVSPTATRTVQWGDQRTLPPGDLDSIATTVHALRDEFDVRDVHVEG